MTETKFAKILVPRTMLPDLTFDGRIVACAENGEVGTELNLYEAREGHIVAAYTNQDGLQDIVVHRYKEPRVDTLANLQAVAYLAVEGITEALGDEPGLYGLFVDILKTKDARAALLKTEVFAGLDITEELSP